MVIMARLRSRVPFENIFFRVCTRGTARKAHVDLPTFEFAVYSLATRLAGCRGTILPNLARVTVTLRNVLSGSIWVVVFTREKIGVYLESVQTISFICSNYTGRCRSGHPSEVAQIKHEPVSAFKHSRDPAWVHFTSTQREQLRLCSGAAATPR
jgi:hypothetical protein